MTLAGQSGSLLAVILIFATCTPAKAEGVVIDFRVDIHSRHRAGAKVFSDQQEDDLVQQLYPNNGTAQCPENHDGDMDVAHGSFTEMGTDQLLVMFRSMPCGIDANQHDVAVILQNGQVVVWTDKIAAQKIEAVEDIDATAHGTHGYSDAVVSGRGGGQGYNFTSAYTLAFTSNQVIELPYISGLVHY